MKKIRFRTSLTTIDIKKAIFLYTPACFLFPYLFYDTDNSVISWQIYLYEQKNKNDKKK